MRRPSPALKTHTFALIAYILRCLLFSFTPTARFQEFFTSSSYLVDHKATTLALHLTFWSVLFATFQVFQILSSSSNLVFSNCVVVTLIYFGPVDFSLMTSW